MKSVAASCASRTYFTRGTPNSRAGCILQELCGGGEAGGHRSLNLWARVGVAAENERWWALYVDVRLVVGIGRLAVLPVVDRCRFHPRTHVVLRLLEYQA